VDGAVKVDSAALHFLTHAGAAVAFSLEADDDFSELLTQAAMVATRSLLAVEGIFGHHRRGPASTAIGREPMCMG